MKSASFTIAINSKRKKKDGDGYVTDFIPCSYIVNATSSITDYLKKGTSVMVEGYIKSHSYEKNGVTVYVTENSVRSLELMGSGSGVNIAVVSGRLTADPDIRQSGDYTVINFTVASNHRRNGEDGAEFIRVTYARKNVGQLLDYLKKGTSVVVSGSICAGSFQKDGGWKNYFSVSAQDIRLSGKRDSTNSGAVSIGDNIDPSFLYNGSYEEIEDDDGEVPF